MQFSLTVKWSSGTLTVLGTYFLSRQIIRIAYYVQELRALLILTAQYLGGRETLSGIHKEILSKTLIGITGMCPSPNPSICQEDCALGIASLDDLIQSHSNLLR